jgi:hypothetical protein
MYKVYHVTGPCVFRCETKIQALRYVNLQVKYWMWSTEKTRQTKETKKFYRQLYQISYMPY